MANAPSGQRFPRDMARAIRSNLAEAKGGVLAFLPAEAEIRRTEDALNEAALPVNAKVMPLYGAMALADQDRCSSPHPTARAKWCWRRRSRKRASPSMASTW
jgi:ATP-dependent helicase HrpB